MTPMIDAINPNAPATSGNRMPGIPK